MVVGNSSKGYTGRINAQGPNGPVCEFFGSQNPNNFSDAEGGRASIDTAEKGSVYYVIGTTTRLVKQSAGAGATWS